MGFFSLEKIVISQIVELPLLIYSDLHAQFTLILRTFLFEDSRLCVYVCESEENCKWEQSVSRCNIIGQSTVGRLSSKRQVPDLKKPKGKRIENKFRNQIYKGPKVTSYSWKGKLTYTLKTENAPKWVCAHQYREKIIYLWVTFLVFCFIDKNIMLFLNLKMRLGHQSCREVEITASFNYENSSIESMLLRKNWNVRSIFNVFAPLQKRLSALTTSS